MILRTSALESTVLRLFGRSAEVLHVEALGADFRLVTFHGPELVGRAWTPGDMVQISFGEWESRAYTPLSYDPVRGTLEFLGYVHGNGIGSAWLAGLRGGERCAFVGPRRAVDLPALGPPAVVFGDETSISTAAALVRTAHGDAQTTFVFEVGARERCAEALERLGLSHATLVERDSEGRHLEAVEAHVLAALERNGAGARASLTGRASTIAHLYKAARRSGIAGKRMNNVAYWSPGRKGFSGVQK